MTYYVRYWNLYNLQTTSSRWQKKKFHNYLCTYFKLEYDGSGIKDGYTGKDRLLNRVFQVTLATRLPMQETQEMPLRSLGLEDPMEKGMAPTPVFLPGKFHGQRSLAGYKTQGCRESDTTEVTYNTCRLLNNLKGINCFWGKIGFLFHAIQIKYKNVKSKIINFREKYRRIFVQNRRGLIN